MSTSDYLNLGKHIEDPFTVPAPPFWLPQDALVQTFAILAIRGAGKTSAATVIAEEFCRLQLPWLAIDPVGVWYGLRVSGERPGFPVVVIGGEHADLPLSPGGKAIADCLLSEPICAVIDLSQESKRFWRQFLTDFCLRLMELRPPEPRHIFIEEAPEFCPQRSSVDLTARTKEAVERLIRLGRNRGYGATLISQRPATIDKDVLSQCENLFVMRTVGAHDRRALQEWTEGHQVDGGRANSFISSLPTLANGEAYFWSPQWQRQFSKLRFRERQTFHPGATRQVGTAMTVGRSLSLPDEVVSRLKSQLAEKPKSSKPRFAEATKRAESDAMPQKEISIMPEIIPSSTRVEELEAMLAAERTAHKTTQAKLDAVRAMLRPQFEQLQAIFAEVGDPGPGAVNAGAYEPWLRKAGKAGCRRLLETLIERPELTRNQLGTLAGVASTSGTFRNYLSWLRRNGLIEVDGESVRLRKV